MFQAEELVRIFLCFRHICDYRVCLLRRYYYETANIRYPVEITENDSDGVVVTGLTLSKLKQTWN